MEIPDLPPQLRDLTPQLRTRLNRMEKAVGWFVLLSTLLLLIGFGYYLYTAAETKGWFKIKARYFTYVVSANGLNLGDPVMLMGRNVGQLTKVQTEDPGTPYNIYVEFEVEDPYFGYLWTEGSQAQVGSGLLGKRLVEVTKGTGGCGTYITYEFKQGLPLAEARALAPLGDWQLGQDILPEGNPTNPPLFTVKTPLSITMLDELARRGVPKIRVFNSKDKKKLITAKWMPKSRSFESYKASSPPYFLPPDESPGMEDRAKALLTQIEKALPNFLRLTNDLNTVLSNANRLTVDLRGTVDKANPTLEHLNTITANLTNGQGSLGEWIITSNLNQQLTATILHVNATMTNANTNLAGIAGGLMLSLDSMAGITSNLNAQVQANTNILTRISDTVVHSDQMIQGLKKHWLLRSAFPVPKTNAPAKKSDQPYSPAMSPRNREMNQNR